MVKGLCEGDGMVWKGDMMSVHLMESCVKVKGLCVKGISWCMKVMGWCVNLNSIASYKHFTCTNFLPPTVHLQQITLPALPSEHLVVFVVDDESVFFFIFLIIQFCTHIAVNYFFCLYLCRNFYSRQSL